MHVETSVIDQTGHIALPQVMLKALGILPNTKLVISLTDTSIVIRPESALVEKNISSISYPEAPILSEKERAKQVLREAGLLTELGPVLKKRAEASTITLDEAIDSMDKGSSKLLSEIVRESK